MKPEFNIQPSPSPKGIRPMGVIVLLVLVVALIGVVIWQKSIANQIAEALQKQITNLQNQILQNESINVTPKNDETADWKTYRNQGVGFELKYPAYLSLQESTFNTGTPEALRPIFTFEMYRGGGRNVEDRIFLFSETNWTVEGEGKPDIMTDFTKDFTREVVVDGIVGHTMVIESMKDSSFLYVTPIKRNGKIYEFWGDGLMFDKILSTFKFAK